MVIVEFFESVVFLSDTTKNNILPNALNESNANKKVNELKMCSASTRSTTFTFNTLRSMASMLNRACFESSQLAEWNNPMAVEFGYTEEQAKWAILASGIYLG